MTPAQTKLFDIWLFLDDGLRSELEDADRCTQMGVERPPSNLAKIQLYRGLLHRFFQDEKFEEGL